MEPEKIAQYKIEKLIGRGGMGAVFKAVDTQLDRIVALKVLTVQDLPEDEVKKRFLREAKAGAQLSHPGIVTIFEVGEDLGHQFIAMEYVKGQTLRQLIQAQPPSISEAIDIGMAVGQALSAAHGGGIIHRDIKPNNVMVTQRDGEPFPKVIDFGIAKATRQRLTEKTLFTRYAHIIGTPAYMSPEQAELSDLDVVHEVLSPAETVDHRRQQVRRRRS